MEPYAIKGTEEQKAQNKRRHTRVDFKTKIVINFGTEEIEAEGNSRDLSLKGVFVFTDNKLPAGAGCGVKIFLSGSVDDIELKIKAKIARVEENGMGIVFDSMDLQSYTYLKNIVRYNADGFDDI